MSPGCTYRSGECDENASWQCRAGGEDSFEDSTLDATAAVPGASLRARVTTAAPPAAHHCCTTTITGTPMLVDQRRSRPGLHRVTVLGSFSVTAHGDPVPLEVGRPAGRRLPCRAPPPAAPRGPGRGPVAGRTRRGGRRAARRGRWRRRRAPLLADGRRGRHRSRSTPPSRSTSTRRWRWSAALAGVPGHPDTVPADLPAATALLSADILPGWTDAWLAVERERFRQIRLNALEELSSRADRRRPVRRRRRHGPGGRAHRARAGRAPAAP